MNLLHSLGKLLGDAVHSEVKGAANIYHTLLPPSLPQQATQKLLNSGYKFVGSGDQQLVHPSTGPPPSQRTALTPYNTPIGIQTFPSPANGFRPIARPPIQPQIRMQWQNNTRGNPLTIGGSPLQPAAQGQYDWWNVYRPQPTQLEVQPFNAPKLGTVI